ncbi:MAG: TPM domain-containing protein [Bdellovibrionaceae bacterium]|nr:TPM domain-containing protein [Pseudobdellovibrionaceae bacterium]
MKLITAFFFTILLALAPLANAFDVPALTGPVMDQAGILQPSMQQSLAEDIYQFKVKTGAQIQVLIVKTLNDEPIENVTIQIFDKWKLGDEKKDTGILFLVAAQDKKMRIEVGQGLEGSVPDVIAKRIIVEVVRPFFQRGQFEVGVQAGVASIEHYILTGDETFLDNAQNAPKKGKIPVQYLLFGFVGIFIILFMFSPALALQLLFALLSGGRGGGGGGGRGGWSGGGGSSSGGGASGDW